MIATTDFKGKYIVAQNTYSTLQDYIDRYEPKLINDLFGATLAADFNNDPTDSKWDDVKAIGFGLKSLLVGLVYFEYVRDFPYRVTNEGVEHLLGENSRATPPAAILRQRYNECVNDWNEMAKYLRANFKDYSGKKLKYMID